MGEIQLPTAAIAVQARGKTTVIITTMEVTTIMTAAAAVRVQTAAVLAAGADAAAASTVKNSYKESFFTVNATMIKRLTDKQ